MGLFSNLFSKKNTAAAQPQPVQMPEEKKPRYIVKSQRFILDNVKDHMEDIMDLVEKNEDYKLKKKDLIEENREDENIYEYEPLYLVRGGRSNYKYLYVIPTLEILKRAA